MSLFDSISVNTDPCVLQWTPYRTPDGIAYSMFPEDELARRWTDFKPDPVMDVFSEKARAIAGGGQYTPYKTGSITGGFTMDRDGDGMSTWSSGPMMRMLKVDGCTDSTIEQAVRTFYQRGLFRVDMLWAGGIPVKLKENNGSMNADALSAIMREREPLGPIAALALLIRRYNKQWADFTEMERRVWLSMAKSLTHAGLQIHAYLMQHESAMGRLADSGHDAEARGNIAKLFGVKAVGGTSQIWTPNSSRISYGRAW